MDERPHIAPLALAQAFISMMREHGLLYGEG
jgi:hypothetical protein